jgi:hypothetical protein
MRRKTDEESIEGLNNRFATKNIDDTKVVAVAVAVVVLLANTNCFTHTLVCLSFYRSFLFFLLIPCF